MIFVVLKVTAVLFAFTSSWRARFRPGLAAVAALAYLTLAYGLSLDLALPLGGAFADHWWLFPVSATSLSVAGLVAASRAAGAMPEGSSEHAVLQKAVGAFLANAVLDTAFLILVGLAYALASVGSF